MRPRQDVMRVARGAAEAEGKPKPPPSLSLSPSPWDCGSPLYDSLELASVYRVLDTHLMALPPPFARRPSRPSPPRARATDADVVLTDRAAVAVAKAKKARSRRRRAATVAKAARRTGAAVLHSICRSVACGRRL